MNILCDNINQTPLNWGNILSWNILNIRSGVNSRKILGGKEINLKIIIYFLVNFQIKKYLVKLVLAKIDNKVIHSRT
jgi:hypothetical protein